MLFVIFTTYFLSVHHCLYFHSKKITAYLLIHTQMQANFYFIQNFWLKDKGIGVSKRKKKNLKKTVQLKLTRLVNGEWAPLV